MFCGKSSKYSSNLELGWCKTNETFLWKFCREVLQILRNLAKLYTGWVTPLSAVTFIFSTCMNIEEIVFETNLQPLLSRTFLDWKTILKTMIIFKNSCFVRFVATSTPVSANAAGRQRLRIDLTKVIKKNNAAMLPLR